MQTSEITKCRDCGDVLGSNSLCHACNQVDSAVERKAADGKIQYNAGAPELGDLMAACGMTKKQALSVIALLNRKLASLNNPSNTTPYECKAWSATCIDQRGGLFFVTLRTGIVNANAAQECFLEERWSGTVTARGKLVSAEHRKGLSAQTKRNPEIFGWMGFGSYSGTRNPLVK